MSSELTSKKRGPSESGSCPLGVLTDRVELAAVTLQLLSLSSSRQQRGILHDCCNPHPRHTVNPLCARLQQAVVETTTAAMLSTLSTLLHSTRNRYGSPTSAYLDPQA
jgi:hypothetical protein